MKLRVNSLLAAAISIGIPTTDARPGPFTTGRLRHERSSSHTPLAASTTQRGLLYIGGIPMLSDRTMAILGHWTRMVGRNMVALTFPTA